MPDRLTVGQATVPSSSSECKRPVSYFCNALLVWPFCEGRANHGQKSVASEAFEPAAERSRH
jgi:hypothetical protein